MLEIRRRVRDFVEQISKAAILKPELANTMPRVYYLNIPKKFIAGTVYDPAKKEVIIDATCTLTEAGSESQYMANRGKSNRVRLPVFHNPKSLAILPPSIMSFSRSCKGSCSMTSRAYL